MEDLSDKGSESEVVYTKSPNGRVSSEESNTKTCADCGTSKTPLWRGGPAGPKSLCNACGIRSRKKRRAALGLNKEDKRPKKSSCCRGNKIGDNMKQRMMAMGRGVLMQRKKKLGEEEQAAVLLMALSYGSVYA